MTMIIHRRHGILCVGFNHGYVHSEVDALKKYARHHKKWHHLKTELHNARITRTGQLSLSEPCIHCSQFIRRHLHFLREICFTLSTGSMKRLSVPEFHQFRFLHVTSRNRFIVPG